MTIKPFLFFIIGMLLLVGAVSATNFTSQYPPAQSDTYVKSTTLYSTYYPYLATDPTKSLTGTSEGNNWYNDAATNERFHIDLGSAKQIVRIYYENSHSEGDVTNYGVNNFTFWGSNTSGSFAELTYATDTGWTQLTTNISYCIEHVASDVADPHYITVTNTGSYRYYAFKFATNHGAGDGMGIRRIELQTSDEEAPPEEDPWEGYVPDSIEGYIPLNISFTDISYNSPTEWNWSFRNVTGDDVEVWFSQEQNPYYNFTYAGNYSIRLNTSNAYGFNITPELAFVNVSEAGGSAPIADFTSNVTTVYIRSSWNESGVQTRYVDPVLFTDTSTNTPTSWYWMIEYEDYPSFWATHTTQNVTFSGYEWAEGTSWFYVRLKATNEYGHDWENKSDYIHVSYTPPVANFTANTTSGMCSLPVKFLQNSTNGTSTQNWYWYDNETMSSDSPSPTAIFSPGVYDVRLKVTNPAGSDWENKTAYINVSNVAPVANFTANATSGNVPVVVGFTDLSEGVIDNWSWTLEGVEFSTDPNPSYEFTIPGLYEWLNLTVSNDVGNDTMSWQDSFYFTSSNVTSDFSANVTSGDVPLAVGFTSSATNATAYNWSFGDGNFSEDQNPAHEYTSFGIYDVSLNASSLYDFAIETKVGYIEVYEQIAAAFHANVTSGDVPLSVGFTDDSNNATSWSWDVDGDDIEDYSVQNPSHEYTMPGSYTVNLTVGNTHNNDFERKINYIVVGFSSVATDFSADVTSGLTPLTVTFTESATNDTTWDWNFGDGSANVTTQNPVHIYSSGGQYTVFLNASNAYSSDIEKKTAYIEVWNHTTNNFVANVTSGDAPLGVLFTDTSYNATSWYWEFGDGNTSVEKSPAFEYTIPGVYSVSHSSSNAHDVYWTNKTNYITVTAPVGSAGFFMEVNNASLGGFIPIDVDHVVYRGDTVRFTDNSTGVPTAWEWSFGDGFGSTVQNPDHTYTYGKQPIIMHDGYKDLEVELTTPEGGTYTDTIRFTSPLAPIVTQSTNITLMNESLAQNYTEALTGNRSAPPGWSGFDWARGIQNTALAYAGVLGWMVFLILVFAIPFIMNWIITKDFVVAGIIGGFMGIYIIVRLPGQMQLIAVAFIVMSVVAVVYSLIKERV